MSEIKVNSIKGVGSTDAAITINNSDGTCTANITNNLSNRNLIINGAMQVAQRGTSSTSDGYQTVDRFRTIYGDNDEAPTQAQADVASGTTPYSLGFRKAFKITNGNQTSGAGAVDYVSILYKPEAQDIANSGWNYLSNSSNITFSFWAKASVAQTYQIRISSKDGTTQGFVFEYSLNANTWTKITKTIPGNSALQFDNDNGIGMDIEFLIFVGTTYTSASPTLDAWGTYNYLTSRKDMTSTWYTTNDATFEITGVQLEVGSVATDFEHRSFGQELALCERYCQVIAEGTNKYLATSFAYSTNLAIGCFTYKTQMRTTPSLVQTTGTNYYFLGQAGTIHHFSQFEALAHAGKDQSGIYGPTSSLSITAGQAGGYSTVNASAKLLLSAEL